MTMKTYTRSTVLVSPVLEHPDIPMAIELVTERTWLFVTRLMDIPGD